jgi:hypothetical protein
MMWTCGTKIISKCGWLSADLQRAESAWNCAFGGPSLAKPQDSLCRSAELKE